MNTTSFALPEGWFTPSEAEALALSRELLTELIPGHLLYAVPVDVIAYRLGTDDILVQHQHERTRFSVVHLSWLQKPEINTAHPTIEYDGDYAGFVAYERAWTGLPLDE